MSGGRATVGRKRGELLRVAGDICAVTPEGHALTDRYYIECKSYKDLDIEAFLVKRAGKLWSFWKECVSQAQHYEKTPMLIAKQNMLPIIVLSWWHPHTLADIYNSDDTYFKFGLFDDLLKDKYNPCPT